MQIPPNLATITRESFDDSPAESAYSLAARPSITRQMSMRRESMDESPMMFAQGMANRSAPMPAKLAALTGETKKSRNDNEEEEAAADDAGNPDLNKGKKKTKQAQRFMTKAGHCNISRSATLGKRYVTDIFTTFVDLQWKYNLLIFVLVYTGGWSLFGFFWWLIAFISIPDITSVYQGAYLWSSAASANVTFAAWYILRREITSLFCDFSEALMGSIMDAFMVGCIYIKLSQPKNRSETLVFSDTCVVTQRDGKNCLMFRVANLRNSLLIQCRIRAKLVKSRITREGEFIGLHQDDINVGFDTGADNLFLVTPLVICHEITEQSPFYGLSPRDFREKKFEIIVILEGMIESTGMICQARTSYLNSEVKWGHRFRPVLFLARGHFSVDHSAFHTTFPFVNYGQCSEIFRQQHIMKYQTQYLHMNRFLDTFLYK